MRLTGKVAIITGAAGGIGYATVRKFLAEGARVALVDLKQEAVDAAVVQLSKFGNVIGFAADVSKKDDCERVAKGTAEKYGRIDIIINNAGITRDAQFYKMTDEQYDMVMNVNMRGTYLMTKAVVPYMMEQRYGKIISASSNSATNGSFGQSNYAASKAAVMGWTRVLAKELGKYNINVNAVAPGFVKTAMTDAVPDKVREQKIALIPLRRVGLPEDIANVYAFLASDEASYINGTTLLVDGGRAQ